MCYYLCLVCLIDAVETIALVLTSMYRLTQRCCSDHGSSAVVLGPISALFPRNGIKEFLQTEPSSLNKEVACLVLKSSRPVDEVK